MNVAMTVRLTQQGFSWSSTTCLKSWQRHRLGYTMNIMENGDVE